MSTAHKAATMPIMAIILSEEVKSEKSICVTLNTINAKAIIKSM